MYTYVSVQKPSLSVLRASLLRASLSRARERATAEAVSQPPAINLSSIPERWRAMPGRPVNVG